jgi:hypothetical protein
MDHMAVEPLQDWASFRRFTSKVSSSLAACGKIWVFVFGQINEIFARERTKNVSDLGALPLPEKLIKGVLKARTIVSIISASASNQVVFSHDGFISFLHERQMSREELRAAFPSLASANDGEFEAHCETTGRIPLQMSKLIAADFSKESFVKQAKEEVMLSLKKLHDKNSSKVEEITNSALSCILRQAMGSISFYDREHLVRDYAALGTQYRAAFPAVLLAYYEYYSDDIQRSL